MVKDLCRRIADAIGELANGVALHEGAHGTWVINWTVATQGKFALVLRIDPAKGRGGQKLLTWESMLCRTPVDRVVDELDEGRISVLRSQGMSEAILAEVRWLRTSAVDKQA